MKATNLSHVPSRPESASTRERQLITRGVKAGAVAITAAAVAAAASCLQAATLGNEVSEAQHCADHLRELKATIERLHRDLRVYCRTYDLSRDEWKQTTDQLNQAYVAALQAMAHFDNALESLRSRAAEYAPVEQVTGVDQ